MHGNRKPRLAALMIAVVAAMFGMAASSHANVPGSALYVPSSGTRSARIRPGRSCWSARPCRRTGPG